MSDNEAEIVEGEVEEVKEEEVTDLSNNTVVTKYNMAADVANAALAFALTLIVPGADVAGVCAAVDGEIETRCGRVFKNKRDMSKGIAFPCCLSINETVAHYSPLPDESRAVASGDMVKIDLGVHVDGYCAMVAHTIVVGTAAEGEEAGAAAEGAAAAAVTPAVVTGPQADVMVAAYTAAEVASKLITPGASNADVTAAMNEVMTTFEVTPVLGTISYATKRFVLESDRAIVLRDEPEVRVAPVTFEPNEVYAIDVAVSSGEGRPRQSELRTTVFKRDVEKSYKLKMRASRTTFSEINTRFPALPFSLRALTDERAGRLGVVECQKHSLLTPFPVVHEREGSFVAHVKFTVLLLPSGTVKITGAALQEGVTSEKVPSEATAAILATSRKKKNKKKKKKAADAAAAASGAAVEPPAAPSS